MIFPLNPLIFLPRHTPNLVCELRSNLGLTTAEYTTTWVGNTARNVGDVCVPTTGNGFHYVATATSGSKKTGSSQPTWPTTVGNTVVDGSVTWSCRAGTTMVSQWVDQRFGTITLAQSTASKRPTYTTNVFGSKPAPLFDTTAYNALVYSTGSNVGRNCTGITTFCVVKCDSTATGDRCAFSVATNVDTKHRTAVSVSGQKYRVSGAIADADTVATLSGATTITTDARVVVHRMRCATNYQGIELNGTSDASDAAVSGGTATSDTNSAAVVLGALPDGVSNYFSGYVGAALVYNRLLTDSEVKRIVRYLGLEYGITVS